MAASSTSCSIRYAGFIRDLLIQSICPTFYEHACTRFAHLKHVCLADRALDLVALSPLLCRCPQTCTCLSVLNDRALELYSEAKKNWAGEYVRAELERKAQVILLNFLS